jgi:type I restriction enzyme S subunit
MKNWKTEILNNLCTRIQSGGTPKSDKNEYYGGDIPFVTIEDITASDKYLFETKKSITEIGLKNSSAWIVPKNSLMYSIYATLGSPLINKIDAATNQAILNLMVDSKKVDNEYLYYFLLFLKNKIHRFSTQTTQSNLNAAIVKGFEIIIPQDLCEQFHIVKVLSTIDQAIGQTEKLIAKYQRIKTGLMQVLLTRGIDDHVNIRSKTTYKFVVKNGIEVPEEWDVVDFEEATNVITDFTANGSFESLRLNVKYYYTPNFARLIRLTDLRKKMKNDGVYVDESGFRYLKKSSLLEGDILFANVGEYAGYTCLMPKVEYKTTIAPNMFLIRVGSEFHSEFLYYLMNDVRFQNQVNNNNLSSTTKLVNKTNLRKFSVIKPKKLEQIRISNKLKEIDGFIEREQTSLAKLQSIKTGLMQDLLTGRVRVNIKEN